MLLKCRKGILFVPGRASVLYDTLILILLTVLFRLWIQVPPSHLFDRTSAFHIYFVKYSHYYVVALLIPFVFCLNLVYGFGRLKYTIAPVIRQVFNFAILYVLSWEDNELAYLVGICDTDGVVDARISPSNATQGTCELYGYTWTPFAISNYMYRTIYAVLIIAEEAQEFKLFEQIERAVDTVLRDQVVLSNFIIDKALAEIRGHNKDLLVKWHGRLSLFLKFNFCALAVLWFGLNIEILLTSILFQTISQTLAATIIAVLFWFLCYILLFPLHDTHPHSLEADIEFLLGWDKELSGLSSTMLRFGDELSAFSSVVQRMYDSTSV